MPARAKKLTNSKGENAPDRGRQVVRLLDILRALEKSSRGLTIQELIEQLELDCSERTVYRDIAHLRQAGFGIVDSEHRFRLDGPTLRAEPLLPSQVLSLLVAEELLVPLRGHELVNGLHSLANSLKARLTPEGRKWLKELHPTVAVTLQSPSSPLDAEILETLREAQVVEQCLRIEYEAPSKLPRTRIIEPHLLWYHGSKPYLVAYCREAQEFRSFALTRIHHAELLEETFERRPDFDPESYVERGFGVLHGSAHEVTVHFRAEVAHLTRERTWHPTQKVAVLSDGSAELRMTVAGLPEIAAWIASFGGKVRAVAPLELVERVRAVHEAGLEVHGVPFLRTAEKTGSV